VCVCKFKDDDKWYKSLLNHSLRKMKNAFFRRKKKTREMRKKIKHFWKPKLKTHILNSKKIKIKEKKNEGNHEIRPLTIEKIVSWRTTLCIGSKDFFSTLTSALLRDVRGKRFQLYCNTDWTIILLHLLRCLAILLQNFKKLSLFPSNCSF